MSYKEQRWGYLVAAVLGVVAVLNLTITHGPGAPKTPTTAWSVGGLVAAAALAGVLRTRNRLLAPFVAIISAFLITFPKVPQSLTEVHLVALIVPVIWAFWVTQRNNRAQRAVRTEQAAARRAARKAGRDDPRRGGRSGGARSAGGRSTGGRSRSAKVSTGPAPNRRYTPPKPKRPRPAPATRPPATSPSVTSPPVTSPADPAQAGAHPLGRLRRRGKTEGPR